METQLDFFRENGYCVAHGALSPDEIEHILEGIAADTDANPELWQISEARRNGVGAPSVGADAPEQRRRDAVGPAREPQQADRERAREAHGPPRVPTTP